MTPKKYSSVVRETEKELQKFIERKLSEYYGNEWWEHGVKGVVEGADKIAREIFKKNQPPWDKRKSQDYRHLSNLYLSNLKEIIICRNNWKTIFEEYFGSNKKKVEVYFDDFCELRNIVSHPRSYDKAIVESGHTAMNFIRKCIGLKSVPLSFEEKISLDFLILGSAQDLEQVVNDLRFLENAVAGKYLPERTWKEKRKSLYTASYVYPELKNQRILLIYGDPGVGKTTYLLTYLEKLLEKKEKVIFLKRFAISQAIEELKGREVDGIIAIDGLSSSKGFTQDVKELIDFVIEKKVRTVITLRNPERKEFEEIAREKNCYHIIQKQEIYSKKEDTPHILANYLLSYQLDACGFSPTKAYNILLKGIIPDGTNLEQVEKLREMVSIFQKKSNGNPYYIVHTLHTLANKGLSVEREEIEELPLGVVNLLADVIAKDFYIKDDKVIPTLLLYLGELKRGFSIVLFDIICEELLKKIEDEKKKVIRENINRFRDFYLVRESPQRLTSSSYWIDTINSLTEGKIDRREISHGFITAKNELDKELVITLLYREIKNIVKNYKKYYEKFIQLLTDLALYGKYKDVMKSLAIYYSNKLFGYVNLEENRMGLEVVWPTKEIPDDKFPIKVVSSDEGWYFIGVALQRLHHKAFELYEKKNYEEALTYFDLITPFDPNVDFLEVWMNKGILLNDMGKPKEAMECFNKILEIDPENDNAWHGKGDSFDILGELDKAIECYDKALSINPHNLFALTNKVFLLLMKAEDGDVETVPEAIELCLTGLEICRQHPEHRVWVIGILNSLGLLLSLKKDYEKAIDIYNGALNIINDEAPKFLKIMLLTNKAITLERIGKFSKAIECYEGTLQIDSKDADIWKKLGDLLKRIDRLKEALSCYDKVLEISPNDKDAKKVKKELKRKIKKDKE